MLDTRSVNFWQFILSPFIKYFEKVQSECLRKLMEGVPTVVQQKQIRLVSMRMQVRSLASLNGLVIWCCHELCRSQMQLGSCVAMAVVWVGSCSSSSTPSLGTSICCGCSPKKQKIKKERKRKWNYFLVLDMICCTITKHELSTHKHTHIQKG